jgi:hypothetical protein
MKSSQPDPTPLSAEKAPPCLKGPFSCQYHIVRPYAALPHIKVLECRECGDRPDWREWEGSSQRPGNRPSC